MKIESNDITYYKRYLETYVNSITTKSNRNRNNYICPLCGSGHNGKSNTPAFFIKNSISWKCYACGKNGDIYSLVGNIQGITNFYSQYQYVVENIAGKYLETCEPIEIPKVVKKEAFGYSESKINFFQKKLFGENKIGLEYINKQRNLSIDIIKKYKIGLSGNYIVIPFLPIKENNGYYLKREINGKKKIKTKYGIPHLYNAEVLNDTETEYIGIVEGEIDALSLIQCGLDSVAIGGCGNTYLLFDKINEIEQAKKKKYIILTDYDDAGQKANHKISEYFKENNIKYVSFYFINNKEKTDANEILSLKGENFLKNIVKKLKATL